MRRAIRRYVSSHDMSAKAHLVRQVRGRKRIGSAKGIVYHLEEIFDELNPRFFHGLLARPRMTWSQVRSRRSLAHYDPAHNTIVVSRIFDHPLVPRYAVEYIVYHEMLHLKHPVKLRGSRRCVHGKEFQAEERLFPQLASGQGIPQEAVNIGLRAPSRRHYGLTVRGWPVTALAKTDPLELKDRPLKVADFRNGTVVA